MDVIIKTAYVRIQSLVDQYDSESHSERSDECIDFTMMCVFFFVSVDNIWSSKNASIFDFSPSLKMEIESMSIKNFWMTKNSNFYEICRKRENLQTDKSSPFRIDLYPYHTPTSYMLIIEKLLEKMKVAVSMLGESSCTINTLNKKYSDGGFKWKTEYPWSIIYRVQKNTVFKDYKLCKNIFSKTEINLAVLEYCSVILKVVKLCYYSRFLIIRISMDSTRVFFELQILH
ncbi:hypothetical protein AGLY_004974 [Aphis glycines]|uniref:Uncharacterized protein n=1 Tax=Aphis glycines TaxID=307491 RepID=A0A6G0TVG9_APHGL|nr:hypothetical protein AGLY_004974 [Aphis glycines]